MSEELFLRLPSRLFSGARFEFPLKNVFGDAARARLRFEKSLLDDESIQRLVLDEFHGEGFEARERRFLLSVLTPRSVFFDIGAHFGIHTLDCASAVPGLRCMAVEPNPHNFRILRDNVGLNCLEDAVHCIDSAVGARSGTGFLRANTSMGHHLSAETTRGFSGQVVAIRTLDELVALAEDLWPAASDYWAKIDTEGRENDVFAGAEKTLRDRQVSGFIWEFKVGNQTSPHAAAIVGTLLKYGYHSYLVSDVNVLSVLDPRFGAEFAAVDSASFHIVANR